MIGGGLVLCCVFSLSLSFSVFLSFDISLRLSLCVYKCCNEEKKSTDFDAPRKENYFARAHDLDGRTVVRRGTRDRYAHRGVLLFWL